MQLLAAFDWEERGRKRKGGQRRLKDRPRKKVRKLTTWMYVLAQLPSFMWCS